jgi:hypothetical protein
MIRWSGYEWLTQERWGQIHPGKTFLWYDPSAVQIDNNQYIHLKTKYNPKYFPDLNVTSNIGVGLISCTTKFKQGTYEIEAKLPSGKNLWPAFWMYSFDSWPPEIDIFESYTNKFGSYFDIGLSLKSGLSIWHVSSNAWWKDGDSNNQLGGQSGWFGFPNPAKNFIKYKLVWTNDSLKYYYNEKLVRTITDKKVLDQCNNTTMNVILNNSLQQEDLKTNSDFVVKYFKYTPM